MVALSEVLLTAWVNLSPEMLVRPTCAYIDPGTGSLVLQIVLGSALACLVALKLYWRQFKGFVGRLMGRGSGYTKAQASEKTGSGTERQERHGDV